MGAAMYISAHVLYCIDQYMRLIFAHSSEASSIEGDEGRPAGIKPRQRRLIGDMRAGTGGLSVD